MKFLLDYFFPITSIEPTPAASTAFLKQVCVVAKPASGQEGNVGQIFQCVNMTEVNARTDNMESEQLFAAGMNKVYILLSDTLDLADALSENDGDFFTVLISSDFTDEEVGGAGVVTVPAVKANLKIQDVTFTAKVGGIDGNSITINYNDTATAGAETVVVNLLDIVIGIESGVSTAQNIKNAIDASMDALALIDAAVDVGDEDDTQVSFGSPVFLDGGSNATESTTMALGTFKGVVGVQSTDDDFLAEQAAVANRAAFHTTDDNKAGNMFYAFGKMLSNALSWRNQQYISMPLADDVDTLGEANALFDDKISFVITDEEFGNRLALFACGGKAIFAPYVIRNLQIDMQSAGLSYISGNQPAYTKKQAALIEDELQKVINRYIDNELIEAGTVQVSLEQDNFVASGSINVSEPKALWRIFGEMRQTL